MIRAFLALALLGGCAGPQEQFIAGNTCLIPDVAVPPARAGWEPGDKINPVGAWQSFHASGCLLRVPLAIITGGTLVVRS